MVSSVGSVSVLDGLFAVAAGRLAPAPSPRATRVAEPTASVPPAVDRVELSDEARREHDARAARPARTDPDAMAHGTQTDTSGQAELTEDELSEVEELKRRDAEVRRHETAHKAAAGPHAGAISFAYTTGPDGRRYVAGGSVPIDATPVEGDPRATIAKMQQVRRAALAPAEPSSADRQVASKAEQVEREARAELASDGGSAAGGTGGTMPSDQGEHGAPPAGARHEPIDLVA